MPYERYTEVVLPHGEVIDLNLWNRVQQTVERINSSKVKNTNVKKIFLLSSILKLQSDNASFHGMGAAVLNFVLRGHQSAAITEEEKGSVSDEMVAAMLLWSNH